MSAGVEWLVLGLNTQDLVLHLLCICRDVEVVKSRVRPDSLLLVACLRLRVAPAAVYVVDVLVGVDECVLDHFRHAR